MGADHTFWYLTRAAGFIAYLLLFGSVTLGLVLTTNLPKGYRRFDVFDVHRFVALLALFVTAFHMLIVLPDAFIGFSLWQLMVPFTSPYAPAYMALGTLSLYLMAIVVGAFYVRPMVPYRTWRMIHYATFAVYAMALVHGIGAGSDTSVPWALGMYAITSGVVVALLAQRVLYGSAHGIPAPRRTETPTAHLSRTPAGPTMTARAPDMPRPAVRDETPVGYEAWARPEDR